MANNIVAFVGYNSFDIILYLSRILYMLGRRILVVDYSDTKALTLSFPQIPGIDTLSNCISYRNIDFTAQSLDNHLVEQYDDILIDCGFKKPQFELELLSRIVYITDMYVFNMKKLGEMACYDNLKAQRALLIREAGNTIITSQYVNEIISKNISEDMVTVLYRDDSDYDNGLLCQHNQMSSFTNMSWMLRDYLINEVLLLCSEMSKKQIKAAYMKARKG